MAVTSHIISASRRTDIPAFYGPWFMNRIRDGVAVYPNPFFREKKYTVDLSPEKVAGIFFWTRYPAPFFKYLDELTERGYTYCFLFTITHYPKAIEPRQPDSEKTLSLFRKLSDKIGPERIIWRYDPVILNQSGLTRSWHLKNFERLSRALAGFTKKVIVSIIDPYKKTQKGIGSEKQGVVYQAASYIPLFKDLAGLAGGHGLIFQSCAEPFIYVPGMTAGGCIDAGFMEKLSGKKTSKARHVQRKGCLCQKSVDIGIYNTCIFGCKYCYANQDHDKALENFNAHDPNSLSLI